MTTQKPVGARPTSTGSTSAQAGVKAGAKVGPRVGKQGSVPGRNTASEGARERELAADSMIWNTRGLQSSSRMRAPVAQRTPPRQLPPSPVPRLMLWAVLIGLALVCFQAVKHMLR